MDSLQARQPRVPFDRAVWVGQMGANGRLRKLYAANLSRGGMFLRTPEPLAIGAALMVALDSSQEIVPLANAEVVWHRPAIGIGIQFKDLQPDAEALLELLLEAGKLGPSVPPEGSLRAKEPVTPTAPPNLTAKLEGLGPEPRTNLDSLPPVAPVAFPPGDAPSETRAFWTGFNLPNRQRVKARVLSQELLLDFGTETVTKVVHNGNRVTLYFRNSARPV